MLSAPAARAGRLCVAVPLRTSSNHTVQAQALRRYLRWRNANARHLDVLAAQ
jgi:hypothetical protein